MKNLIVVAGIMLLSALSLSAQVVYQNPPLSQLLARAGRENKHVLVMASSTWCGPCKLFEKNVLTTKEAGDYMNERFLFIRYLLDKNDADSIMSKYEVHTYPSFLILNPAGEVCARIMAAEPDAKSFIAKVEEVMRPEVSELARVKKFQSDPDYLLEYVKYLKSTLREEKANQIMGERFLQNSFEENFSEKTFEVYNKNLTTIYSPIVDYMLVNKAKVMKTIGEEKYLKFMNSKAGLHFMHSELGTWEGFQKDLERIAKYPEMQNPYLKYVVSYRNVMKSKDYDKLCDRAIKDFKSMDTGTRGNVVDLVTIHLPKLQKVKLDPELTRRVLNAAIETETDEKATRKYKVRLERIKG